MEQELLRDREYKSKVDWWYHGVIILLGAMTIFAFISGAKPLAMVALLVATLGAVHALVTTRYRLTHDGYLEATCSILPVKRIAVADIEAIQPTMAPVSSYALSLNRLTIWVDQRPWLLVSPADRDGFIKQLRKMNPNIQLLKSDSFI